MKQKWEILQISKYINSCKKNVNELNINQKKNGSFLKKNPAIQAIPVISKIQKFK